MSKSMLCHRVSICAAIANMNEKQCLDVIRSIQKELDCNNLNDFLIKVMVKMKDTFTNQSLENIEKDIRNNIANFHVSQQSPENCDCNDNKDKNNRKNNDDNNETLLFPLLGLPIDLITTTSFFLDQEDICQFEQCCRLFYQITNNLVYITKSNSFKI